MSSKSGADPTSMLYACHLIFACLTISSIIQYIKQDKLKHELKLW